MAPDAEAESSVRYAELECTSNFTFLTRGESPRRIGARPRHWASRRLAITDTHTVAGVVQAHVAAKQAGIRCVVGTRIVPEDAGACGAAVSIRASGLRRALPDAHHRETTDEKESAVSPRRSARTSRRACGSRRAVVPKRSAWIVRSLRAAFTPDRLSVAASFRYGQDDARRVASLAAFASDAGVPLVATNASSITTRPPAGCSTTCWRC